MKYFLRYACMFCGMRLIWSYLRRRPVHPASACNSHWAGILLGVLSLPFFGIAVLLLIGFATK